MTVHNEASGTHLQSSNFDPLIPVDADIQTADTFARAMRHCAIMATTPTPAQQMQPPRSTQPQHSASFIERVPRATAARTDSRSSRHGSTYIRAGSNRTPPARHLSRGPPIPPWASATAVTSKPSPILKVTAHPRYLSRGPPQPPWGATDTTAVNKGATLQAMLIAVARQGELTHSKTSPATSDCGIGDDHFASVLQRLQLSGSGGMATVECHHVLRAINNDRSSKELNTSTKVIEYRYPLCTTVVDIDDFTPRMGHGEAVSVAAAQAAAAVVQKITAAQSDRVNGNGVCGDVVLGDDGKRNAHDYMISADTSRSTETNSTTSVAVIAQRSPASFTASYAILSSPITATVVPRVQLQLGVPRASGDGHEKRQRLC